MLPRGRVLRWLAAAWLAAAVTILGLMLMRPELAADQRRALSTLVPLYFMSFPAGHAGLAAVNEIKLALWFDSEFVPPVYTEGVFLWVFLTVSGYAQWFVLTPWLAGWLRRLYRFLFTRESPR